MCTTSTRARLADAIHDQLPEAERDRITRGELEVYVPADRGGPPGPTGDHNALR